MKKTLSTIIAFLMFLSFTSCVNAQDINDNDTNASETLKSPISSEETSVIEETTLEATSKLDESPTLEETASSENVTETVEETETAAITETEKATETVTKAETTTETNTETELNTETDPDTETDTTIETEIETAPEKTIKITKARSFSDGVAIVSLSEYDDKGWIKSYDVLIDDLGNILFKLDDLNMSSDLLSQYHNGVSVYKSGGGLYGYQYVAVYDKKGNVVISPEKNDFDNILAFSADNSYFIVDKTEEAFSGDIYMIGIIDLTGNYVQQISSTHILAQLGQSALEDDLDFSIYHIEDDIFGVEFADNSFDRVTYYYHLNKNELTSNYDHIEWDRYGKLNKYSESGECTELFVGKDIVQVFDNGVLIKEEYQDASGWLSKYTLYDYSENVLLDLSEYNICRQIWEQSSEVGFYYYNGYFLTQVQTTTGALYCCLFDADGKFVFEPIRMNKDDHFYPLNKNGFIYKVEGEDGVKSYSLYKYDGTIQEMKYAIQDLYAYDHITFTTGPELVYGGIETRYFFVDEEENIVISGSTITEMLRQ